MSTIRQDLLAKCESDHVGLWEFIDRYAEEFPEALPQYVKSGVLDMIEDMLHTGQILAGKPNVDGKSFNVWNMHLKVIMDRIKFAWNALGRFPRIGEIVWFTSRKG